MSMLWCGAKASNVLVGLTYRRSAASARGRPKADHEARQLQRLVGGGVWEAGLDFGPGYRIYFGRIGREVVLLLLGGDKKSQTKDIKRAKGFWSEYLKEMKDGKTR